MTMNGSKKQFRLKMRSQRTPIYKGSVHWKWIRMKHGVNCMCIWRISLPNGWNVVAPLWKILFKELLILKQFLRMVEPELEVWICEHNMDGKWGSTQKCSCQPEPGTKEPPLVVIATSPDVVGPIGLKGVVKFRVCFPKVADNFLMVNTMPISTLCPFLDQTRSAIIVMILITHSTLQLRQSKPSLLCSVPKSANSFPIQKGAPTAPMLVNDQCEKALLEFSVSGSV